MTGILLTQEGDLDVSTGALRLGDVRAQTSDILLMAMPGELREYPLLGLGVRCMLGGPIDRGLPLKIKKQLRHCGIPVTRVRVQDNTITIE